MKTTASIFLRASAILTLALGLTNPLSAQSVVSPTGIPIITSYVPSSAAVGESVLANLQVDSITTGGAVNGNVDTVTHILFRSSIGLPISVPVTYVAPKLIRFTIPERAITGTTTLMKNTQLHSRVQPSFSVVSFARRSAGFSVINTAQWAVSSIKTGATELLPTGTRIPAGQAHFVPRVLNNRTALPLNLTFVSERTVVHSNGLALFSIAESVKLPAGSGKTGLTLVKRVELPLEPFTVTEILRMGGSGSSTTWPISFNSQFHRMTVTDNGNLTLSNTFQFSNVTPVNLSIDEASAELTSGVIRFRVRQNGRLVGPVLSMAMPFDVFAANQIGPVTASNETPMIIRRGN